MISAKHFSISDQYDSLSVERLEKFLMDGRKEISTGKFWVALQANVLSDQSMTSSDFEGKFKIMMSKANGMFTIPNLDKNMRNAERINEGTQIVHRGLFVGYKLSDTIEKLPAPTTSSYHERPTLITTSTLNFESNFQNMLYEEIFDPKQKTLIIHSKSFKGTYLKSLFLTKFPTIQPDNILQHDNHPNDANKKDLQDFLRQPEIKIGIFQSKFVSGMECSRVIYFNDAKDDHNTSVRCSMTRAVSHLCIILQYKDDDYYPPKFLNVKVNNNFIKCKSTLDKNDNRYKCLTCNTNPICASCLFGCHYKHPTRYKGYVLEKNEKDAKKIEKCRCTKSECSIKR